MLDFLKYAYESINGDLKFAEAKNVALITFNSAVLGVVFAFFNSDSTKPLYLKVILALFLSAILISTIISLLSFNPLNDIKLYKCVYEANNQNHKFMFYRYNSSMYSRDDDGYSKFQSDVKKYFSSGVELAPFEKQLTYQIVDLSHIARIKFTLFSYAIKVELFAALILIAFIIAA